MLAICGMMTSAIPSSTTIEESTEVVEQVLSVKPQLKQKFKRKREIRKNIFGSSQRVCAGFMDISNTPQSNPAIQIIYSPPGTHFLRLSTS